MDFTDQHFSGYRVYQDFGLVSRYLEQGVVYTSQMGDAFDLDSATFQQSLADTIAWCGSQQITSTFEETDDIRRRRSMGKQASELTHRAYEQRNQLWNRILRRDYTDSRLWKRGMNLHRQADLGSIVYLDSQLRTPALRPQLSMLEARTDHDKEELVRSVIVRRSELMRVREQSNGVNTGKLLLYTPDETLSDGAARVASEGFFDDDNLPPWDTWVAFSRGILLSWVPPQLIPLAQVGIDVNPEVCIRWMD
jgi:hypothetical protein